MNIEQIKADREAGTQGAWGRGWDDGQIVVIAGGVFEGYEVLSDHALLQPDQDRIIRVPDLENFAIEAMELLDRCLNQMEADWYLIDNDRGVGNTSIEDDKTIMAARAFLKKYTKPD